VDVKTIAVIGAGTMGRGIAYAAALGGYHTVLEDVSRHVLEQGIAWIRQSFDEGVARGKVEAGVRDRALSLISTASNVEDAIRDAELIIEAVPEELEMKLELFTISTSSPRPGRFSRATLLRFRSRISRTSPLRASAASVCISSTPCQR